MSDTPPFAIRFTITPTTALDATRLFTARYFARYIAVLVVVLTLGLAIIVFGNRELGIWLSLVALFLFATARLPPLERWMVRQQIRSIVGGDSELVLGEDGIHYRNPVASGSIDWSGLTEVRANDLTVVFVRDRLLACYAPASAFGSPAQREAALAFARARIGAATSSPATNLK